jgi:2-iminobutanoate/2-iminopropanoate deaminase
MIDPVFPENAPRPVGPYSPAIKANGFVFVSGQIPLDPKTGQILRGPIAGQVNLIFSNLQAVLEAAGSSLDKVVKTTVYLRDMSRFSEMNEAYAVYFQGKVAPARSTIQAAELPAQVDVEIDAIALL